MAFSLSISTVHNCTRPDGPLFLTSNNSTATLAKFQKILERWFAHDHQSIPISSLVLLCQLSKNMHNYLDVHNIMLASIGFRVQNKTFSGHVSRLLLARSLTLASKVPELTRQILNGLGGSQNPEKIMASKLSKTKKLTNLLLHEVPEDEAAYWRERFLSLLRTSSVPTLIQAQDVASAYSYVTVPTCSSIPKMTPSEVIDIVLEQVGTQKGNSFLFSYLFALTSNPFSVDRSGSPHAFNTDDDKNEKENEKSSSSSSSSTKIKRNTPSNAFKLLTSVDDILHAIGFLHHLSIDDLQLDKWDLKPKKTPDAIQMTFPTKTKRAIFHSFLTLSPQQLYDVQKKTSLWKVLFKSISFNSIYKAELKKTDLTPERRDRCLFLGIVLKALRRDRYPKDEATWKTSEW